MGHNRYRFTLSHTSGSQIISEPEGWRDIKLILERDKEFHSLIELFEIALRFYGSNGVNDGGMDYIDNIDNIYGPDAQISMLCEISTDEGTTYEDLFLGLLDMQAKKRIDSRRIEVPVIRDGFWARFKNRYDTPVDLKSTVDEDGEAVSATPNITTQLPSQKIRRKYSGYLKYNTYTSMADAGTNEFGMVDFDTEEISEIDETYHYSLAVSWPDPTLRPFPKFTVTESGDCLIQSVITVSDLAPEDGTPKGFLQGSTIGFIKFVLQINDGPYQYFDEQDIAIAQDDIILNDGVTSIRIDAGNITQYSFNQTITLNISDSIRIFPVKVGAPGLNADVMYYGQSGDNRYFNQLVRYGTNGMGFDFQRFAAYYDASTNLFPSSLPPSESLWSGRVWIVSNPGVINSINVSKDWVLMALEESPGQDPSKWYMSSIGITESLYQFGETYLNLTFESVTPTTDAEGFFIHDVAAGIADRITAQPNSFYSEYLGSSETLARQYDEDGCEWNHALLAGLQIRQYLLADKPFSRSFKQWWDGANPIFNLGLTYDEIVGNQVIRVENKGYFYDPDPVIYLDFVNNIVDSYDKDMIFKKVKIGYKKWQSEDISGIDDVQTVHEYALLFKTIGADLNIESDFIAASLAIETTRRTTKEKSTDYKYDNETFIISLNPTPEGSPETYLPELDENFSSITNLLNSDTRYNTRLSPARNLLKWANYIFGCVQKNLTSVLKFNRGEGNFDMTSTFGAGEDVDCPGYNGTELSEKQDIDVTTDYLFQPIILEFKFPLSFEDYKLIRSNRTKAIGVSETDSDHAICFIKKLEYDINGSLGTFTVWKR